MRPYKNLSDRELIEEILIHKNSVFFEEIYDRYVSSVFAKCLSFSKDKDVASDLVQEVFVKIYLQLNSFHGRSKFSTWLYSLTSNYCIDQVRKKRRSGIHEPIDSHDFIDQTCGDEDDVEKEMLISKLEDSLNSVSDLDKQILEMKYLEGLSLKAIKSKLNIGESAIKMRLKRAKDRLSKNQLLIIRN